MSIERPQPIVLGINEDTGALIWGNVEMPEWQRKMFPIRYRGDFQAFWQKLKAAETQGRMSESTEAQPNFVGFKAEIHGNYTPKTQRRPWPTWGD